MQGGSFNVLRYGARVEITPEPFDDFFMLELPISGGAHLESPGRKPARSGPDRALFLPPQARFCSDWQDGTLQLMLKIRKELVLERWQRLCGEATAQLPSIFPEIELATQEGRHVRACMAQMKLALDRAKGGGAVTAGPALAAVDAALAYFHKHQATRVTDGGAVLPAHLRACVRHIHDNLTGDLSVPALLRHTEVSERTLFKLFRRFLHKSPRAYVEAARLKRARALLLDGCNVAVAARGSGFGHLGRFAATYEAAYGEKPSQTRPATTAIARHD